MANGPNVNCSCAWGDPIIDESTGNCSCPSGTADGQPYTAIGGIKPPVSYPAISPSKGGTVINYYSSAPAAPSAQSNTIFGLSPIVVLGAALAGLFLLSSMDGKK